MKGLASDVLGQVEASAEEMGTGLLNGAMSLLHSSGSADQEASGEAKAAAPTASSGTSVAVSRDDKHLYTANSSGEVRIYSRDGETGMLELLKTVGPKPMPKGGLDAEEEARKAELARQEAIRLAEEEARRVLVAEEARAARHASRPAAR